MLELIATFATGVIVGQEYTNLPRLLPLLKDAVDKMVASFDKDKKQK